MKAIKFLWPGVPKHHNKTYTVKLQKRLAGINIFYKLQMRVSFENHQNKPVKIEGIIRKRVLLEGESY